MFLHARSLNNERSDSGFTGASMAKYRLLLLVTAAIGLVMQVPVFGAERALVRAPELQPAPSAPRPAVFHRRAPLEIRLCFPGNAAQVQRCSRPPTVADALRERVSDELFADELGTGIEQLY